MDRRKDRQKDGLTDRRMEGRTEGHKDGRTLFYKKTLPAEAGGQPDTTGYHLNAKYLEFDWLKQHA